MNLHKHLLRHIFCLSRKSLPQNRESKTKYPITMAAKQLRKGVQVASLRSGYELGIAIHPYQRPASRFKK